MKDRRSVLRFLASSALALPLVPGLGPRAVPAAAAAAPVLARPAGAEGFFIVNGWVLTRADLDALRIDAV